MGARALFEALCHPYHNELPRAQPAAAGRASISRATTSTTTRWPGCSTCWPATTLGPSSSSARAAARWKRPPHCASSWRPSRKACRRRRRTSSAGASCRSPAAPAGSAIWPRRWAAPRSFPSPRAWAAASRCSRPVGLLPAAVLGLDVVELLEGAAAMNERFRSRAAGREPGAGFRRRRRTSWNAAAAPRSASSPPGEDGSKPSACGTTSCSPRAWARTARGPRRSPWSIPATSTPAASSTRRAAATSSSPTCTSSSPSPSRSRCPSSPGDEDKLNELAGTTLPRDPRGGPAGDRPGLRRRLPPHGQPPLAEARRARRSGSSSRCSCWPRSSRGGWWASNPYGQPGVEAYKRNMNAILRG